MNSKDPPVSLPAHERANASLSSSDLRTRATFIPLDGKKPIPLGWNTFRDLSEDEQQAILADAPKGSNRGLLCGHDRIRTGLGVCALDVDCKPERVDASGKKYAAQRGPEVLALLEKELGPLPRTLTSITPSGGRHLLFRMPAELEHVSNKVFDRFAREHGLESSGIEFQNEGHQIVFPGSVINDEWAAAHGCVAGSYRWEDESVLVAELPLAWVAWLIEESAKQPARKNDGRAVEAVPILDRSSAYGDWRIRQARKFLARAPLSIRGAGGRNTFFGVCTVLVVKMRLPQDVAADLIEQVYHPRLLAEGTTTWNRSEPSKSGMSIEECLRRAAESSNAEPGDVLAEDEWNGTRSFMSRRTKAATSSVLIGDLKERLAENIEKSLIQVTSEWSEAVDQSCEALVKHPNIYQRSGRLIQPVKIAGRVDWARGETASGVPIIREIPAGTLACELTRVARFERFDARSRKWVGCVPDVRLESAVAKAGHWPGVRTLERIVETPLMRADGSILQEESYDAATAVIFDAGGVEFPHVPDAPTLDDARTALADLLEPFAEFPFATDADMLVPAAIVLTSLAMGALDGANFPCFVLDANVQGTGKTLCADAIAWILTGRAIPKQTFPSDDKNELEKILGGVARAATPMLCLDNVNGTFGGDGLEQRITCRGTSQFRILGKSEQAALPWRTIVLASGNNVRTTPDMRRRVLRCRLVSKVENPEDRAIKRTDLRGWILERRPALIVAGLTVLRAYVVAGRPKQAVKPMGNFEDWSALVAGALKWASGVDVLDARMPEVAAVDPVTAAYAAFLASVPENEFSKLRTTAEIARMPCWDELMADAGGPGARATRVGLLLAKMLERPIDGRQVEREKDAVTKNWKYRVVSVTE